MAVERKLLGIKKRLTSFRNPIIFLERNNGTTECYDYIREGIVIPGFNPFRKIQNNEFPIPNLEPGVEKKIILGKKYLKEIPYAGGTIKYYDCHEDWLFPHQWSQPNIYQGPRKEAPNAGWILEMANINSEVFRDRERKVLNAWERFKAKEAKHDWMEIAKAVAIVLGVAIAGLWAWNQFGPKDEEPSGVTGGPAIPEGGNIIEIG